MLTAKRPECFLSSSDVILHIRYTARDGGGQLRSAALQIKDLIDAGQATGSVRFFSMRHEFAAEWAKFRSQTPGPNIRHELGFALRPEHYPYWSEGRLNTVMRVDLFAESSEAPAPAGMDVCDRADKTDAGTLKDPLTKFPSLDGLLVGRLANVAPPSEPTAVVKLYFDNSKLSDLWLS